MSLLLPSLGPRPLSWGPPVDLDDNLFPEYLKDLPIHSFSKPERSSRVADWSTCTISRSGSTPGGGSGSRGDGDDEDFRLVDNKSRKIRANRLTSTRLPRLNMNQPRFGNMQRNSSGGNANRSGGGGNRHSSNKSNYRYVGGGIRRYGNDSRRSLFSININPLWGEPLHIFEFNKILKIRDDHTPFSFDPTLLLECGQVRHFNVELSKTLTPKSELSLRRHYTNELKFNHVTSSEDPNFVKFSQEGPGRIFMTDTIFSLLMVIHRSIYPWDLLVTKKNESLWFDTRSSRFDTQTVNENATEPPDPNDADALNTPLKLSQEAVLVQNNFSQQVLLQKSQLYQFSYTNPFSNDMTTLPPVGYRYVSYSITDDWQLIVRVQIDAILPPASTSLSSSKSVFGGSLSLNPSISTVLIRSLNEYDTKVTGDWRKKLENQPGGVLATELKNNMAKIQRWVIQALAAQCETIVLGFISRQTPKDNTNHTVLSIETYKPNEFVTQMSMNLDRMWVTLKSILTKLISQPDGQYLLLKEPSGYSIKLYQIPAEALERADQLSPAIKELTL